MDFEIRPQTILLTRAGSRAYGLATENSDLDVKGACIPPSRYYFGCIHNFEQAQGKEHIEKFLDLMDPNEVNNGVEGTIYELKKYLRLLIETNANSLETLYCRDQDILYANKFGELLRANRHLFLSTKVRWALAGYSFSQLKKIRSHNRFIRNPPKKKPERTDFGLPEAYPKAKYDVAFDAIQKKIDEWAFDLSGLPDVDRIHITNKVAEYLTELKITSDDQWLCAGRAIGLNDDLMAILEKERQFRTALKEWKQYQDWMKNRNPERKALEEKYGYDCKFAVALIRLLKQCREILTTGKVHVWRGEIDADELLAIKRGAWSYEQVEEFAAREDKALGQIYDEGTAPLPHSPDHKKIDEMCQQILEEAL